MVADGIGRLSRIVTLNNLVLSPVAGGTGILGMDAVTVTYRALDEDDPHSLRLELTSPRLEQILELCDLAGKRELGRRERRECTSAEQNGAKGDHGVVTGVT